MLYEEKKLLIKSIILFVILEISLILLIYFISYKNMSFPLSIISTISMTIPLSFVTSAIFFFSQNRNETLNENAEPEIEI